MGRTMRRIARSAWLRALLALLLCLVAVPGALPAPGAASAASAAPVADKQQRERSIADDQVRVLYCTSCGYQQSFVQVKDFLEDKYPHLVDRIYGTNYDVSPAKQVGQTQVEGRRVSAVARS